MKKKFLMSGLIFWIIIAIALGALLIAGATGAISFPAIFGSIGAYFSCDLVRQETVDASDIKEIKLDCSSFDVKIMLTDGDDIVLRQYDRDDGNPYKFTVKNGIFDLTLSGRLFIGVSFGIPRIEIEIPEIYAGKVTVKTSSGSIKCGDYVNWSDITLKASSGSIKLEEEISCAKLSVSTSSGTIRIPDVNADSVVLSSSSGTVRLGNVTADTVEVSSSSGSQHLGDIISKEFSARASSGTVSVGDVSASKSISLHTSSGNIKAAGITCDNFTIEASSGTIAVSSLCGAGNLNTTSGNIGIEDAIFIADTSITAKSGSVKLSLFDGNNISFDLACTSGTIRVENSNASPNGKMEKQGHCRVGNGSDGTVTVKTTSGNIKIY